MIKKSPYTTFVAGLIIVHLLSTIELFSKLGASQSAKFVIGGFFFISGSIAIIIFCRSNKKTLEEVSAKPNRSLFLKLIFGIKPKKGE